MRPLYETPRHLVIENETRALLVTALGGKLVKMPISYGIDWALVNTMRSHTIEKWVELKCRNNTHNAYPTFFVSAMKVMRAIQLEEVTGIQSLLVVRFTDGLYAVPFKRFLEQPRILRVGGRADRNDAEDQEAMWHMQVSRMTLLMALPSSSSTEGDGGNNKDEFLP